MRINLGCRQRKKEPSNDAITNAIIMAIEFKNLGYNARAVNNFLIIKKNFDNINNIKQRLKEHGINVSLVRNKQELWLDTTTMTKAGWSGDDFKLCAQYIDNVITGGH